ncbi:hypothetical protein B0H19DRAFT_1334466 [Mycena capillaripes]|nr:hypothetical protein B0H19DRAFT_1334466 [Mycena capillaripes]
MRDFPRRTLRDPRVRASEIHRAVVRRQATATAMARWMRHSRDMGVYAFSRVSARGRLAETPSTMCSVARTSGLERRVIEFGTGGGKGGVTGRVPVQDSETWDKAPLMREDTAISSPPASIEDAARDFVLLTAAARLQRRNCDNMGWGGEKQCTYISRGSEWLTGGTAVHVRGGTMASKWRGAGILVRTRKKREVDSGDLEEIKVGTLAAPDMNAETVGRGRGAAPRRGINGENTASRVLWANKYERNAEGPYLVQRATLLAPRESSMLSFLLHPWVSGDAASKSSRAGLPQQEMLPGRSRICPDGAARWIVQNELCRRCLTNGLLNLRFEAVGVIGDGEEVFRGREWPPTAWFITCRSAVNPKKIARRDGGEKQQALPYTWHGSIRDR